MSRKSLAVVFVVCALAASALAAPASKAALKPKANPNPYRLILPPEIVAVPGIEANIYFDNVILARNTSELVFDVDCAKGAQQRERWTYVPTTKDVGKYPLTIKLCDDKMKVITTASTIIRVVPADAGAGKDLTCLIIGDSLTAASAYPRHIVELFARPDNPKLTLVGTTDKGNGCRHEGYGGWTFNSFITRFTKNPPKPKPGVRQRKLTSPFVYWDEGAQKPVFDFARYIKENAKGRGTDFVTIALGCNDTFSSTEESINDRIDTMFGYADQLVNAILAVRPDTKVGILTLVPPAGTQDAFGQNYRCGQTRWQYRRNQHLVVERTYAKYGKREADNIFIVPAYVNLDTIHGYPVRTAAVNANAKLKVGRLANGVHPATDGYYQMADSIYCWIKGQLAK